MKRSNFIRNLVSLYGVQIASLILPLVSLPYLSRVLKLGSMGELSAIQSLSLTFSLVIEYGFVFSATRQIALYKEDKNYVAEIVSKVLSSKIILSFLVIILSIIFYFLKNNYNSNPLLFEFGVVYAILQGFSPFWYFQGIEKLQSAVLIDTICRFLATIVIFFVVKNPQQNWIVMAIQSFFLLISLLINYLAIYRYTDFFTLSFKGGFLYLIEGWNMFLFRASVMLYTTANTAILGLFVPTTSVAEYANADKLVNAAKVGVQPITQILFPKISQLIISDKLSAIKLLRRSSFYLISLSIIISLILWIVAPYFIPWYFGKEYYATIRIFRLLLLSIPLIAFSNILGIQWMLPLKMDKAFNIIIISAGLLNIFSLLYSIPHFGNLGMVYSILISEIFVDVFMVIYLVKKKDFPLLDLWRAV